MKKLMSLVGGALLAPLGLLALGDVTGEFIAGEAGGQAYYKFTGDGTYTVTGGVVRARVLVVGGGGGGANAGATTASNGGAGGGGAGGFVDDVLYFPAGVYSVVVGAGGESQTSSGQPGNDGMPSYIVSGGGVTNVFAFGGGGGGIAMNATRAIGRDGGSGGGGSYRSGSISGGVALQPSSAWGGYGSDGGYGSVAAAGAGGGGAGGPGGEPYSSDGVVHGGEGGYGGVSDITGEPVFYAAGGAGGSRTGVGGFPGNPSGGTGAGGDSAATDGAPGTGSGGGGGANPSAFRAGGAGGSGVVILRIEANRAEPFDKPGTALDGDESIRDLGRFIYTGSQFCAYAGFDGDFQTYDGTMYATEPGEYEFTLSLREGLAWSDGTTAPVMCRWSIDEIPVATVTFDLGEHGELSGGGELVQEVEIGNGAVAPVFEVERGWLFTGWSDDFSAISTNITVTAQYEQMTEYSCAITGDTVDFAGLEWLGGLAFPDEYNTLSRLALNVATDAVVTVTRRMEIDSLVLTGPGSLTLRMEGQGAFYPGAIDASAYNGTLLFVVAAGARLDYYLGRGPTYDCDYLPFMEFETVVEEGARVSLTYSDASSCNLEYFDFSRLSGNGLVSLDTVYSGDRNWICFPRFKFADTLAFHSDADVVVPRVYTPESPFTVRNLSGTGRFRSDWDMGSGLRGIRTVQTANSTYNGRFMGIHNVNVAQSREINFFVAGEGEAPDYGYRRLILGGEGGIITNSTAWGATFHDSPGTMTVEETGALEINYMWGGPAEIYGAVGGMGGFASNLVFHAGCEFVCTTNTHLTATGSVTFPTNMVIRMDSESDYQLVLAIENATEAPDLSNTTFQAFVNGVPNENYRLYAMQDRIFLTHLRALANVVFAPGEHGSFSDGETSQIILPGMDADAPTVAADWGWRFAGWSMPVTNIAESCTITALYEPAFSLSCTEAMDGHAFSASLTDALGEYTNVTWSGSTEIYAVVTNASTFTSSPAGTGIGLTSDDVATTYTLPFAFPFYGREYTTVYPSSNGTIFFNGRNTTWTPSESVLKANPMIAGMWRDLRGGNCYVTTGDDFVKFRWQSVYYSGGASVNFSVTLYRDGRIVCSFGSGNSSGGWVGISSGDGTNFVLYTSASSSLANHSDVEFVPSALPDWLTLTPDGTLTGTPLETGTFDFNLIMMSSDGEKAIVPYTITVAENPNVRPEISPVTATNATLIARVADGHAFQVAANDANGDALTYHWYMDGGSNAVATTTVPEFHQTLDAADTATHTMTCDVTDGFWTIPLDAVWSFKNGFDVTFELGDYVVRTGGGELSQLVGALDAAVAPQVAGIDGYDFDGWDAEFGSITADTPVRAKYVRLRSPAIVDGLVVGQIANAGATSENPGASIVEFSFDVSSDDPTQTNYVYLVARDEATGAEYPIRSITGVDAAFTNGTYSVSWNASADLPAGITGDIRIHAFATAHPLAHRWGFNGNYLDTADAMDAIAIGNVTLTNGAATLAGGSHGTSYITLGREVFPGGDQPRTVELWARQDAVQYWGTIFMIGVDTEDCLYMQWTRQSNLDTDKVSVKGGADVSDRLAPYSLGVDYHISMTLVPLGSGVWDACFYKQDNTTGETIAKTSFTSTNARSLVSNAIKTFNLGRSFWGGEYDASATYNEVRVWNAALREKELTLNAVSGVDLVSGSTAVTSAAFPVVTFDLGQYLTHVGGGALVQVLEDGDAAIAPEVGDVVGWRFTGWDADFSNVTTSMVVTAQYEMINHNVTLDLGEHGVRTGGGELTQTIQGGTSIVEPLVEGVPTGYVLAGWDANVGCVTNDVAASALYTTNITPIVWRHKKNNGSRLGWDYPLENYTYMGEVDSLRVMWKNEVDAYYQSYSQNRLDGWFYVPQDKAGEWEIRQGYDDYMAVQFDGVWITQNTTWQVRVSGPWTAEPGWHRFALVYGDTSGDYGVLGTWSEINQCPWAIGVSINGGAEISFADSFRFGGSEGFVSKHPVRFSFGEHGARSGGGEAEQYVFIGDAAEEPAVTPDFGWAFIGWDAPLTNITSETRTTAQYASLLTYAATNAMDGVAFTAAFSDMTGDTNVTWSASGMPGGLTIGPGGVISGTLLTTGNVSFTVTATASDGRSCAIPVTIFVEENPNHRPVVEAFTPSAAPELTLPGETLEFSVTASEPDGDELLYVWLIDGVTNAVTTVGEFSWTPAELDGGTRVVTCLVTDGFWSIPAGAGWSVSIPKWYVSGDGDNANAGTTASTPLRDIQAAVDAASEGDVVFVAEGVYGPVGTASKRMRILATGELDKTVIDGGGTNRCVYVGNSGSATNTTFAGFVLRNGYGGGGAGACGGRFDNCIIENCTSSDSYHGGGAYGAVLNNCLVRGNTAYYGGGAAASWLNNCTVVGNTTTYRGGGTYNSTICNTIVWDNTGTGNSYSNYYSCTFTYSCTAPAVSGTGNISIDPYFTDPANGDWRLRQYSPCLDTGSNSFVVGDYDLAGTNRVCDGTVDMGCYEGWVYLPLPEVVENVFAEDGTRIGIVRVMWDAAEYAKTYNIYRASTNNLDEAALLGSSQALFFDDETAEPEVEYWYWVSGVNPAGEGEFGSGDSGWCMAEMAFGDNALPTAMVGIEYNAQLVVTGGSGVYTWTSGAEDYDTNRWESTYLLDIDAPQGLLFGDDVSTAYPLPFDFPFYARTYNKLWVSSNGTLTFDGEFRTYTPSLDTFKSRIMIAPFWKDLLQGSGGVYVSENGDETGVYSVTFMWYNGIYYSGHGLVNASVTLFADGGIVCSYGDGNANGAFVGISAGDGVRYRHFDLQGVNLGNADDIVFEPQDVPAGLTLSSDGVLSGSPDAPGEYVFTVFVTDEYGNGATRQVRVTIDENPHVRVVRFDLGEYGVRGGGGDLMQYVMLGESATPPTVRVRSGWVFDGWDGSYTNITDHATVTAKYRSAYVDLLVSGAWCLAPGGEEPAGGRMLAGETLHLVWTVENKGNPSFNGTMTELVRFTNAADPADVRTMATLAFEGVIERDCSVERSADITLPLKGMEGEWIVTVETAVNPSTRELAGNNTSEPMALAIDGCALPDIALSDVQVMGMVYPGDTVEVSYVCSNVGTTNAVAPWLDRVVLVDAEGTHYTLDVHEIVDGLADGAAATHTVECTIPELVPLSGDVTFVVESDFDNSVTEIDDAANNTAQSAVVSLPARLYLTAAADSVRENNASGVRFTVKRSGPVAAPLAVAVNSVDGQVTFPETVTIPAKSVSTTFTVVPVNNNIVEGSRTVDVAVSASNFDGAELPLTIIDDEVPHLYLELDKSSIREGDGVIIATVTRELVTDEPVTVYLSGASTSRCSYPGSVVIPAGEASVTFEIAIPNNATAQIAQDLTLRASSSGFTSTSATYTVEDDDVPGVTLSLTPDVVSEGAGANAIYAILTRSDTNQITQAVTVRLWQDPPSQLIMESQVTIPKYTMAVRFPIGVIDNALDDGDREVTINGAILIESCGCNGQPSNGDVIEATVIIIDNDGPALALSASPTTMKEGLENAGYLTLSHNSSLVEDMTVMLWTDEAGTDEIIIPESVVIPAGVTSVRIPVTTIDDGVEDGGQLVTIYADAGEGSGFAPATTWLQVSDQNLPDLKVASVTAPNSVVAMEDFEVAFIITNGGFNSTSKAISYTAYLVSGTGTSYSSYLARKTGAFGGGLAVGETLNGTVTFTAPELPGNCRVAIVVDPDDAINELDEIDNTRWSSTVGIGVAYTAVAGVYAERDPELGLKVFQPGETVTITGMVKRADGTPAANVRIDPYVVLNGTRRSLLTRSAADGTFSVEFTPSSTEAGDYGVGACYPGVNSTASWDSFSIIGMSLVYSTVTWDMALGDTATRTVTIRNRSSVPLTDLAVSFTDLPDECGFVYTLPNAIPGNGSVVLSMTATADGLTEQTGFSKFYAHIEVAEGLTLDFPLFFHSKAQSAYLRATPGSISTTMAVGQTRYIDVSIANDGKGDSGAVSISIPDARWLKIVSGASIDNLRSGESATVTLAVSPAVEDGLTLNSPLRSGSIAINCENGNGTSVALRLTPVSEATGSVAIDAVDNNTYMLESAPHLAGASIRVTNPYTGALVASGTTAADGKWSADNIPEGRYQLTVTAPNHDSFVDELVVDPGAETSKRAFLQYKLVSATWTVVPTEIEDSYEITLMLDYETQVPAPIVKTTMPDVIEDLEPGESILFNVHVENVGLIAAESVLLVPPDIPDHEFTFADNGFRLPAGQSIDIPVKFEHLASSRPLLGASTRTVIGTWLLKHVISYLCGENSPSYTFDKPFKYGKKTIVDPDSVEITIINNPTPNTYVTVIHDPVRSPDGRVEILREPVKQGRGTGFTIPKIGCRLNDCWQSIIGCIIDILVSIAPGESALECATGLIDCGLSVKDLFVKDHSPLAIAKTTFGCGMSVLGCTPWGKAKGVALSIGNCIGNIGIDCIIAPLVDYFKKNSANPKSLLSASAADGLAESNPGFAAAIATAQSYYPAILNWYIEFFGDETWMDAEQSELTAFVAAVDGMLVNEGDRIDAEALRPYKPETVSEEAFIRFVSRWNALLDGTESDEWEEAGTTQSVRPEYLLKCGDQLAVCLDEAQKWGYATFEEFLSKEAAKAMAEAESRRDAVCASVGLSLSQTLTMTREAFEGTLTMYNGSTTTPLENLKMDLTIIDEEGNLCNDLFVIRNMGVSGGMSGDWILDGGMTVSADSSGSAVMQFIPSRSAAETEPKVYNFGGRVTYKDPFTGENASISLIPVTITVSPSPYLHLDYFVQRDVYADDPFTADVVEASMPAELAVLVRNVGAGDANNVTIASAKPSVVKNEKGLLVDFDLKDYSVDKAALNGATAHLGLNTVSLGTIEPNESQVVQWWLTSTIEGHFIGMSASVTPVNSWNTPDTMLVDPDVGTHMLVRSIVADADELPDFLVSDGGDLYGTPNAIYTAAGEVESVYMASVGAAAMPAGGEVELALTVTPASSGWNYGYAAIPGVFKYTIASIVRGDGTELPLRNAWITDRTFRDGATPLLEERLHIVDEFASSSPQTYTVRLVAKPTDVPEVAGFEGVASGAFEYDVRNAVTVVFTKAIDPATFTVEDLTLVRQGAYALDLSALTITAADATNTRFVIGNLSALCGDYGRFELTVQCAGIADDIGQLGSAGRSIAWTYTTAEAPYVLGADGVPVRRVQSLDRVIFTLGAPIDPATFTTAGSLRLNGAALPAGVTIEPLDDTGTRFAVSGLSGAQTQDGQYELTVDATTLSGLDGTPGIDSYTARWTRDTQPPVLEGFAEEEPGLSGRRFALSFNEGVEEGSVTLSNVRIMRSAARSLLSSTKGRALLGDPQWNAVAMPAMAQLLWMGDGRFILTGVDEALSEDGEYMITVDADGATDEAGNTAQSATRSLTIAVDTTPPEQIEDLAISPDGGYSATDGVTYTQNITVTGTLPEDGVYVEILVRYVSGSETVLAEFDSSSLALSRAVSLPSPGNITLVVRLSDQAGNSSETTKALFIDATALTAEFSGLPQEEETIVESASLTFSAVVMEGDVTLDKFTLMRDGEAVALAGVSLSKTGEAAYALTGLGGICAEDGNYMLRFAGAGVRKHSSGLAMVGDVVASWRYENPDREPPTITAVLFDGAEPAAAYTDTAMFSTVSVAFSEEVNIPALVESGAISRAVRLDLLDAASGAVTGCVSLAEVAWDAAAWTLTWSVESGAVPAGAARVVVDSGLVTDIAGNHLAAEGWDAAPGTEAFAPAGGVIAQVNAQAMPAWCNGELYVGEKTAASKGKIRRYAANGAWSYVQSGGADIEIPAQGCQGASIAFADMDGDGEDEIYVGTAGGDVLRYPGGDAVFTIGVARAMPFAWDMDGDGRDELLIGGIDGHIRAVGYSAAQGAYYMAILPGASGAALSVPNGRASPVVADINSDGLPDILSGDTAGNVWAFMGDGSAWLDNCVCLFTNDVALADRSRIAYADMNGDGICDIIVGRSDGSVTLLAGSASPSPSVSFEVNAVVTATAGSNGAISPAGETVYAGGDEPEYAITPGVGYHVADVTVDGVSVGATNAYVFAPLAASHTIHADFEINTYAVTFAPGAHGALTGQTSQIIEHGAAPTAPNVTAAAGYEFVGWDGNVTAPVVSDIVFTATYSVVPYAISYTGLKGAANTNPATYTVEDEIAFAAPGDVYGWVFTGWTPASIARGTTGAVTARANWRRRQFGVTVDGEVRQCEYEAVVEYAPAQPVVLDGDKKYTCIGWTATNAEPNSGEGAVARFAVMGDVALEWLWQTNVVTLAEAVDGEDFEWRTGGVADWHPVWSWEAGDATDCALAPSVPNGTNAWIAVTVDGAGEISFTWASAFASRNTKLQVLVDGEVKGMLSATNDWTRFSVAILGDWPHEVAWRLVTGRSGANESDWAALDGVSWTPAVPPTLAEALNTNLFWSVEGDADWSAVARSSLLDEREAWAVASDLGDYETATVKTRVFGSGILTFDWAVSCEDEYDWVELTVDDVVRDYITGEVDWRTAAIEVTGDGWHTIAWTFVKDEIDDPDLVGENVARLDNVVWNSSVEQPSVTQTTPEPVPFDVIAEKFPGYLEAAGGDYEAAAHSIGRNGYAIWQSYIAGLDADDENSRFISRITLQDGVPVVTWEPDTPELRATRTYTKFGKRTLDAGEEWTPIENESDMGLYHFFKVEVKGMGNRE